MAGLFSRIKVWVGLDVVQNTDLNAEFDNIIQNLGPSGMSGWSSTVAQMQIQTSPGKYGAESLATSTNGEIERLRYQMNAVIGGPDGVWYDPPALSLSQISGALATVPSSNRIISGATNGTSLQPLFLVPGGSTKTVTLQASSGTPFICAINGTTYTFTANITSQTLATAPSSNNTFTINDTNCDSSNKTKGFGAVIQDFSALNDGSYRVLSDYPINGNAVGSGITSLLGSYQAFSVGSTEYFIGYIPPTTLSTSIALTKCLRGYFYNSTSNPISPVVLANSATVSLMQLAWIYLTTAGALVAVYTNPRYAAVQPSSSASGDMWYDTVNQTWKQSNGSLYTVSNSILIGVAMSNTSNCVAARSFDVYRGYSNVSNVFQEYYSASEYRTKYPNNVISVYGNTLSFDKDSVRWTSGTTESSSVAFTSGTTGTTFYNYLSETGAPYVSNYAPLRRYDLGGYYHPYNSWRCCGMFLFNASANFDQYAMSNLVNLNGEFVNERSISIRSLKPSPTILYDTTVSSVSPVVADFNQISVSNPCFNTSSVPTSASPVLNTSGFAIGCGLNCAGRSLLVGLTQSSTSGYIQYNAGGATSAIGTAQFYYYLDSNLVATTQYLFWGGNSSEAAVGYPVGSTHQLITNVSPGQHILTMKYSTSTTALELQFGGINMFMKEI